MVIFFSLAIYYNSRLIIVISIFQIITNITYFIKSIPKINYCFNNVNVGLMNGIVLIHPVFIYAAIVLLIETTHGRRGFFSYQTSWKKTNMVGCLLSLCGVILGGYWAQQELNWGGWWNWDPVEMGGFMFFLIFLINVHGEAGINYVGGRVRVVPYTILLVFILVRVDYLNSIHSFVLSSSLKSYDYIFIKALFIYSVLVCVPAWGATSPQKTNPLQFWLGVLLAITLFSTLLSVLFMFYKNIIFLENLSSLKYPWSIIFLFALNDILRYRGAYWNYIFNTVAALIIKKFINMRLWVVHGSVALLVLLNMTSVTGTATIYNLCAGESVYYLSGLIRADPQKINLLGWAPQYVNYVEIYFNKSDLFIFLKHYYINCIYNNKFDLIMNYSVDGKTIQFKHKNLFLTLSLILGGTAVQWGGDRRLGGIV